MTRWTMTRPLIAVLALGCEVDNPAEVHEPPRPEVPLGAIAEPLRSAAEALVRDSAHNRADAVCILWEAAVLDAGAACGLTLRDDSVVRMPAEDVLRWRVDTACAEDWAARPWQVVETHAHCAVALLLAPCETKAQVFTACPGERMGQPVFETVALPLGREER